MENNPRPQDGTAPDDQDPDRETEQGAPGPDAVPEPGGVPGPEASDDATEITPPADGSLSSREEREAVLAEVLGDAPRESRTPEEQGPSLSTRDQREATLADVERETVAREFARLPRGPDRTTTRFRAASAAVVTAVAAWLWIFPPGFLSPPAPPVQAPDQVEAGLRFAVALQAQRILLHRDLTRRLPDFLREVGDTLPGLAYRRLDGGTFLLVGRSGDTVVQYRSDESLADFVAPILHELGAPR